MLNSIRSIGGGATKCQPSPSSETRKISGMDSRSEGTEGGWTAEYNYRTAGEVVFGVFFEGYLTDVNTEVAGLRKVAEQW